MEENIFLYYLEAIPGYLSTPMGVAGLVAFILFAVYCLFGKGGKWVAVTTLLTVGIIAKDEAATTQTVMIPAIEALRTANRVIFGLTLILLAIRMLTGGEQRWRREMIPKSMLALSALQILYALGWLAQGDLSRGSVSIVLSLLLLVGLAGMVGKGVQSMADVRSIFRASEAAGLLFCGMSIAQLMGNASAVYLSGRFQGISANPQYAAIFTAILVNISVYMMGASTEPKVLRLIHGCCAVLFISFMLWTGSRTGMVIITVGLLVQLRLRLWMMLAVAAIVLIGMYALNSINEYSASAVARLVTFQNTRETAYNNAYAYFERYPVFGRATLVVESCYLAVASCTGIVGLIILFLCGFFHLQNLVFIWQHRRWLGKERRVVDLLVAWSLALLGASFFEGFVLAIATAAIVFVILLFSLTAMVREYIEVLVANAQLEGYPQELEAQTALA